MKTLSTICSALSLLATAFVLPTAAFAVAPAYEAVAGVSTSSAGIAESAIWFSKDPFSAGEKVKISTIVYNASPYRFEGTVAFDDGGTVVATREFALPAGKSLIIEAEWIATAGKHDLRAKIAAQRFTDASGGSVANAPAFVATGKETRNVLPLPPSPSPSVSTGTTSKGFAEHAPEAVRAVASSTTPVIGVVETWRTGKADDAGLALRANIAAVTTNASSTATITPSVERDAWDVFKGGVILGEAWKSPFDYAKLFLLLVWRFLFAHPVAFYVILALVALKIIKTLWRLIFR